MNEDEIGAGCCGLLAAVVVGLILWVGVILAVLSIGGWT